MYRMKQSCCEACLAVESEAECQCERWMAELESGGNVKFITGDPSLPWYKSCADLTNSRFSVADVEVCVCVCACRGRNERLNVLASTLLLGHACYQK